MKKCHSVFMLLLRISFRKVLLILGAMFIIQLVPYFALGAWKEPYLLDALEKISIPSALSVYTGIILVACSLYVPLSDRGGRMNNLILRLGLREQEIFWIHVVYNVLIYSLLIMVQSMTMIVLCLIHDWLTPGTMDPVAIFVTSYQYPLFHRFFPLHNVIGWINHLVFVSGLSICTAAYPIRQRHRYMSICTTIMVVYSALYYGCFSVSDHLHYSEMILPFVMTLILVSISLFGVMSMEVDDDGKT